MINSATKGFALGTKVTVALPAVFSKRELEILWLMAEGLDSEQIGAKLHVSLYTVRTHRRNMLIRHNCLNTAALIAYAFRKGIIS
ncbi:response regulator transcription factor [Pedobacter aquatilis]|uniref:response regulator transcription factor n=1 Tax=Pedobacter aquatilis TaxID=351343 RepID=UPI00292FE382|nr:LuxR C-terminal-related transcriptional regulator [Pedobacter aquatilis]